jgi:hypothetical protein
MSTETAAQLSRVLEWRSERLIIQQTGQTCVAVDKDGFIYARLSCELETGAQPPAGYFWLRWWNENQYLCEALVDAGVITTQGDPVLISPYVSTVPARIVPEVAR